MKRFAFLLLLTTLVLTGYATSQQPEANGSIEEKGEIYIPKDLDDCFVQLQKILKPDEIEKMKNGTEDDMIQYHRRLGMWMRNNWGLWRGSRLAKWFSAHGIKHPDDMSGIILDSFWRHLNEKPINLEEQVRYYQDYWKKKESNQQSLVGDSQKFAPED